jgi:pyruvate/2-oxoglutarate dehydrogenase complex dihydrolipoamide acyltransferase (E2) component
MKASRLSGWRKVASAMWREPDDPQIYGALDVDAGPMLAFVERARAAGHKLTPTHFVGRALAHALRAVPDLNVCLVAGEAIPRPSVDVFFITMVGGGRDLSGVKVARTDEKSVYEVAAELGGRARTLKAGKDPGFAKSKRLMDAMPTPVLRVALRFTAWLTGERGVAVPALSLEASPFGSAMVTSVGSIGLPLGFVPLAWMYKVPILVLAGEIMDKPMAVDKRVEVRPILPISVTIDHRYVDGWHIGQALAPFRAYLADPAAFEPSHDGGAETPPNPPPPPPA